MKLSKVTVTHPDPARRRYDDACGTAHALDLIGERWALLVMRELMLGPRRFSDLRASLPGISANVLTQRLEGLEGSGIVARRKLPPPANVQVYELTAWGLEAEPILLTMGAWAARSPAHDPTLPFSPASLLLSFRAKLHPAKTKGLDLALHLRMSGEDYAVAVRRGALHTARETPARADVVVDAEAATLAALIYGKLPLRALEQKGAIKLTGARATLSKFASLYALPPKAPA